MIEYRKIGKNQKKEVQQLAEKVIDGLERKEFFIPITNNEYDDMFNENKSIIYGAYDGEKLIGIARMSLEQVKNDSIKKELNLENNKVARFGKYLVLSEYRNQGIMQHLQIKLIEESKKLNFEYIIILAHPENKQSNGAIKHMGAELAKTTSYKGYLRNVWILKL